MDKTAKHIIGLWLSLVAIVPSVIGFASYIYLPRLEKMVQETIREEIRDPENREFIECLIASQDIKGQYMTTSEMLQIFRNVPRREATDFHRSEIKRLEEKKAFLLSRMSTDFSSNCSGL